jgi:hypothetical protein
MANVVTAYRDMHLSDRNADASLAAILAYLEDSAPPQPPPLPPLAPVRRIGTQNLPPVKNLLTHPEDWSQSQDGTGPGQTNGTDRKVYPKLKFG